FLCSRIFPPGSTVACCHGACYGRVVMNWVRAIVGILVLWSSVAMGATLTWDPNTDSDLGGYRIYQCSLIPCGPGSGNQSLLATIGTATSFNIGAPTVTQYYFITAVDTANNESGISNLVTFTPSTQSTPTTPPIASLALTVVGTPGLG